MADASDKKWLEAILRGDRAGRWYKDGNPTWVEGPQKRQAKTSEEAEKESQALVKFLKRHGKDIQEVRALRRKIKGCELADPCTSSACPKCSRAFQRWYTQATHDFIESNLKSKFMTTLVSAADQIRRRDIDGSLFRRVRTRLERVRKKSGISVAIGGCDVSFNKHSEGAFPPHWQPHAVIFTGGNISIEYAKGLYEVNSGGITSVCRPVRTSSFDGSLTGIAYSMKANFFYRETLPPEIDDEGNVVRQNTRARYLQVPEKLNLLIALDKAGLMSRLILVGVHLIEGKKWPKIVQTATKSTLKGLK